MPTRAYRLSPYCIVHSLPDDGGVRVAHGLYGSRFDLSHHLGRIVARILDGAPVEDVVAGEPEEARQAIESLIAEKVLIDVEEMRRLGGGDTFRSRLGPVELALHRGFNEGGYFPEGIDQAGPPPMAKEIPDSPHVQLESHGAPEARKDLAQCLAERRSIRAYADEPMAKQAFEHFLELTARAYAVMEIPGLGRVSLRNYPSGGARYPLEVYPFVYNVAGLEPGVYHYHPFHHRLASISCDEHHREQLLERVKLGMGPASEERGRPAALLVISAVFARTCWKYRGIPYHLILQEVGALYQTMYLAATLLDLAPCAIGAFPELAVNELLQLDGRDEAQVGLFVLGVPRPVDPAATEFVIEGVRRLEGSPFSPDPDHASLEISFRGGLKEIVDLDQLQVERSPAGPMVCHVMHGRHRAELNPTAEAQLAPWLRARREGA